MFPVYDISDSAAQRPETLGTKEKFWLIPNAALGLPNIPHLFKIGRPNTGENWAEKVCCEILKEISLPCAEYNFAICNSSKGVISQRFHPKGAFVPANMILSDVVEGYDGELRFRQVKYRLSTSLEVLKALPIQPPIGFADRYPGLTACDFFIGYLVLLAAARTWLKVGSLKLPIQLAPYRGDRGPPGEWARVAGDHSGG
jgi:hypothetical protein